MQFKPLMTQSNFPSEEIEEMHSVDIQTLVTSYLEDMAEQVQFLYARGDYRHAELLRQEGLEMAEAYDNNCIFMFINDLTETY
jgi:hypothetical protein